MQQVLRRLFSLFSDEGDGGAHAPDDTVLGVEDDVGIEPEEREMVAAAAAAVVAVRQVSLFCAVDPYLSVALIPHLSEVPSFPLEAFGNVRKLVQPPHTSPREGGLDIQPKTLCVVVEMRIRPEFDS